MLADGICIVGLVGLRRRYRCAAVLGLVMRRGGVLGIVDCMTVSIIVHGVGEPGQRWMA